ncbi:MAG: GNAT family N-acetyltransferase [Oscillospiraceae bacterium]|nr:GNAT family N-acetyltransferase [Oscillospiraceae bacterium]
MNREEAIDHIETDRLILFPFTEASLALFNSDLTGFENKYGIKYQGEELDWLLRDFLKKLEREIADDPDNYLFFTEFLITLKETDSVIGSIDYKYVPRDGLTEVGYGLNPQFERRGYMTEALTAFLDFGRRSGLKAVLAETKKDNTKSQNVLKRCGFVFLREGGNLWWKKDLELPPTPAPPFPHDMKPDHDNV